VEHLLDFCITKVYEPQKDRKPVEGEGEYGPWKLYNFYTDKTGKEKFGFMWSGKKPIPTEGLKIKHMEYEKEKRGQYTNLDVKKLELPNKIEPEAISNANEDMDSIPKATNNRDASFYVAYASQMWCAMVSRLPEEIVNDMVLSKEAKLVTQIGLDMMTMVTGDTPSEAQNIPLEESEPKEEPDFDLEPKAITKAKIIDPKGIPKVVCTYKGASFKGKEILTMYCKGQCEFKDSCPTAKQLREAE